MVSIPTIQIYGDDLWMVNMALLYPHYTSMIHEADRDEASPHFAGHVLLVDARLQPGFRDETCNFLGPLFELHVVRHI